jgi:hypothetical protein
MSVSLNVFSIQLKQCLPGLKTRKNQLGWPKHPYLYIRKNI